jgi:hypothetical protein
LQLPESDYIALGSMEANNSAPRETTRRETHEACVSSDLVVPAIAGELQQPYVQALAGR